jgi:hypothetical protein
LSDASVAADPGAHDDFADTGPAPTNSALFSNMALRVLEAETGEPISHAKLHLAYLRQDGRSEGRKAVTDAKGRVAVAALQSPFRGLNLFVTADAHVPKVTTWGFGRAMPSEYTMKLGRGVSINGAVIDEAGQPVVGARIEFDGPGGNDSALPENIQFGPDTASLTDAEGHWSCDMIPKDLERGLLLVVHPDHAETTATLWPHATEGRIRLLL